MKLKTKEINQEIGRVMDLLNRYYHWRAEQHLGCNLKEPNFTPAPIEITLRELFDHVSGVEHHDEIADICQSICEALFVAPGNQGGEYSIPESFWETLTGRAVRFALGGDDPTIADDDEIEAGQACALLGVSRATLQNWRADGTLTPSSQNTTNRGWRYRAGDVRALKAKRK